MRIICTHHGKGSTHDFKLFKTSRLPLHVQKKVKADSGYQGMQKIHPNCELPCKGSKCKPLTDEQKQSNKVLSGQRVVVEQVIGRLKVFKILAERYRKGKNKHAKRFNLICAIFNYEH